MSNCVLLPMRGNFATETSRMSNSAVRPLPGRPSEGPREDLPMRSNFDTETSRMSNSAVRPLPGRPSERPREDLPLRGNFATETSRMSNSALRPLPGRPDGPREHLHRHWDATGAPPATLSSAQMALSSAQMAPSVTSANFHDRVAHKATVGRAAPIGREPATATDRLDNRHFQPPPDMRREDERLKTFDHRWPKDAFVTPADLARTGFYFLGRNDEVRCAFCKIEIGRFERGDEPAGEHARWAPQCPLLRRRPTGNVPLEASESGRDECGPRAARVHAPAHPKYASEAARLRTFANWPLAMRQKPEQLADAGLFYTGEGDKTVCFHCDGGLKDWQEDDDPWEQHARWFQRCAYVQLMKGKDYVQRVMTELAGLVPSRPARDGEATSTLPAPKAKREVPRLPAASVPKTSTPAPPSPDDSKLCKICYEAELDVCFVPCGHVVACSKCALTSDKCPLCRRTYQSVLRLYYS